MKIAYKPVSVLCSYLSRINITINFKQPTQTKYGVLIVSIWSCSRWGLPCQLCYHNCGALLPHLFTLTDYGGIFSAALSLQSPSPGVTRHRYSWRPDFPLYINIKQLLGYLHFIGLNFLLKSQVFSETLIILTTLLRQ